MSTLQINDLINPARLRLGIKRAFTGDVHEILSEAIQNSARAGARNIWITTGVTAVEWNGQVFTRRSPNNKFAEAVWFSRHLGQDADGNKRYARLISFRALSDAEPIAAKAKKAIRA